MPEPTVVAAVSIIGAIAAAATATRRPFVALGILFVLASTSRVTLDTPIGTMRLEQPAIAAVALVLLATGRWRRFLGINRGALVVAAGFAVYLAVLTVSSALVAPTPIDSLRLVAWLAISMVGALVAFILVWPDPDAAVLPLAVGGALKGAVGIAVAIFFLVGGPTADIGIQEPDGILPRVHAFTWEANLYASFLAMCVPLALESARGPHRTRGLLLLALVVVGLPLGITRGAYLGLVAGIVAYAIVLVVASGRRVDLRRLASATLFLLLVGVIASSALLPNLIQRASGLGGIGRFRPPPSRRVAGRPAAAHPALARRASPLRVQRHYRVCDSIPTRSAFGSSEFLSH